MTKKIFSIFSTLSALSILFSTNAFAIGVASTQSRLDKIFETLFTCFAFVAIVAFIGFIVTFSIYLSKTLPSNKDKTIFKSNGKKMIDKEASFLSIVLYVFIMLFNVLFFVFGLDELYYYTSEVFAFIQIGITIASIYAFSKKNYSFANLSVVLFWVFTLGIYIIFG